MRYSPAMKMRRAALIGVLAIMLSVGSTSPAISASWQEQMLSSLNTMRSDKGLKPLKLCNSLSKAAQDFAKEMATQNFYAHEGLDGSTPGQRIQSAGYKWQSSRSSAGIAENIAAGQGSVLEVMKDWKNSTGHFKNMTGSKFVHVGFGMSGSVKSTYKKYWVQNFGYGAKC